MRTISATILAATLLAAPAFADPPDITGTWTGTAKCQLLRNSVGRVKTTETISLAIHLSSGSSFPGASLDGSALFGLVVADPSAPASKGEVGFIPCNELLTPRTSLEGKFTLAGSGGTLKATLITLRTPSTGDEQVGTCKAKLTRTSTTDPGPIGCSPG